MPSNRIELPFPLKGVSGDSAFGRTPEGMSPDALNVVGYDAVGNRLRGGQRPGLSKFWTTQLGSSNRVQALTVGTSSKQASNTANPITDAFDYTPTNPAWSEMASNWDSFDEDAVGAATPLFQTVIDDDSEESATIAAANVSTINSVHYQRANVTGAPKRTSRVFVGTGSDFSYRGGYTVKLNIGIPAANATVGAAQVTRVLLRVDPNYTGAAYVFRIKHWIQSGEAVRVTVQMAKGTSTGYVENDSTDPKLDEIAYTENLGDWRYNDHQVYLVVAETGVVTISVYDADLDTTLELGTLTMSDYEDYSGVGFGGYTSTNAIILVDNFRVTDVPLAEAGYEIRTAAVCNGDVYTAKAGLEPVLATDGSGALALATARRFIGATLHHGSSTDASPTSYHQMVYFADGTNWKRVDLSTRAVIAWDLAAGLALPVDLNGNTPTIIATYRDRIVLSGLIDDPQNWFMSAVGNADDFDYSPATLSATMAVAGNNSTAGVIGDRMTALAPYSDDVMIMGGDHTVWIMRGDPASKGIIDNISYKTGISGPRAFAWDPFGQIHFFGAGTHWTMSASSSEPKPVSRGRMDRIWGALDLSTYDVQLAWDVVRQGLHILVVPYASGTTTHWFWDQRTDAYWPTRYPNNMNPSSVLGYDADKDGDTALLFGGFDGYVRKVDPDSKNDDGTAINSYVLFGPVNTGESYSNTKLQEVVTVMSSGTDGATLSVFSGETPESALGLTTLRFARTVAAGRTVVRQRAAGNTLVFRLQNSTVSETWALEAIEAALASGGRTRKKSL